MQIYGANCKSISLCKMYTRSCHSGISSNCALSAKVEPCCFAMDIAKAVLCVHCCRHRYLRLASPEWNCHLQQCGWHSRVQPPTAPAESQVPPFEVEGLILCNNPNDLEQRGVFNVHTQTWHAIPPGPGQSKISFACGLLVDTTVKPYTFKLIEGSLSFKTQIYDSKSRSWSRTFSILPPLITESLWTEAFEYSCICHNDSIYMSGGADLVLKYCLENDKWTSLKSPKLKNYEDHPPLDDTLGVWDGRIFTAREIRKNGSLTVWELVNSEGQKWVEYARMSEEQYEWLLKHDFGGNGFSEQVAVLRWFFRDGYLLVCSWLWEYARVNELVVFDMATKIWRKVDLPKGTVAIDKDKVENSVEG